MARATRARVSPGVRARARSPRAAARASAGAVSITRWLVARVRGTYRRGNWAGKGALLSIEGVTAEAAHYRHPEQHTIAEIVLHMAYWKDAVTAGLIGQPWEFDDQMNWRPAGSGEGGWSAAKEELAAAQKRLMAALRTFTPGRALERIRRGRVRLIDLVTDIATHDTYHAAQIFVLRRLPRAGIPGGAAPGPPPD